MNYIDIIKDSVETSLSLNLYKTREQSLHAHVYKAKLEKIPISAFNHVVNFNTARLQNTPAKAYPKHDRPRGDKDIKSVRYYVNKINNGNEISPIWLKRINGQYVLLDGAHRIVATYVIT
jgi:hypothetical protein